MKSKDRKQKIETFNSTLDAHLEKNNVKINDVDREVLKIYYKRNIANGFIKKNTILGIIKELGLN